MLDFDKLMENDNDKQRFISGLMESNRDIMMNIVYKAIIEQKMGALNSDIPKETKTDGLNVLIKWFEDKEEYEKCAKLKNILNSI